MAYLTGSERAQYVQGMFSRIAHRYDLMNCLMTAGQVVRWRREVIQRTELPENGYLLDLGAGTGDLAMEAQRQYPDCHPVTADFTLEMMRVGIMRHQPSRIEWTAADVLQLPYPADTFNAVASGFLLRNVSNVQRSLEEQYDVLKPRGRIVSLDTTRPQKNLLTPLINLHLNTVIPALGQLVTGHRDAYDYLPESTESFLGAEQLAGRLIEAGFRNVGFRRLMFGTVAIHWGTK